MEQLLELKEPIGLIKKPQDIFNKIKKINIEYEQENFLAFFLNTRNKVIQAEVLFKGGLSFCLIDIKTLFRKALKYNAFSLIVAHNHPSGNLNPSDDDLRIMEAIKKAGDILTLKLLDFIIFNKVNYYCVKD